MTGSRRKATRVNGPLIVQSDKTLLLEVDHEQADACRRAIAPFAELERAPEHIHTYRLTPLGLWNARAAGHDAEQVVDALVEYSPLPGAARAARRHRRDDGPLRPAHPQQAPGARAGPDHHRPAGAGGDPALEEDPAAGRRPDRPGHRRRAPLRARADQADAAEAGLARRGPRRVRRRRGAPDRAGRGRLGAAARTRSRPWRASGTAAPGVVVLPCGAGKTLVGAGCDGRRPRRPR